MSPLTPQGANRATITRASGSQAHMTMTRKPIVTGGPKQIVIHVGNVSQKTKKPRIEPGKARSRTVMVMHENNSLRSMSENCRHPKGFAGLKCHPIAAIESDCASPTPVLVATGTRHVVATVNLLSQHAAMRALLRCVGSRHSTGLSHLHPGVGLAMLLPRRVRVGVEVTELVRAGASHRRLERC